MRDTDWHTRNPDDEQCVMEDKDAGNDARATPSRHADPQVRMPERHQRAFTVGSDSGASFLQRMLMRLVDASRRHAWLIVLAGILLAVVREYTSSYRDVVRARIVLLASQGFGMTA